MILLLILSLAFINSKTESTHKPNIIKRIFIKTKIKIKNFTSFIKTKQFIFGFFLGSIITTLVFLTLIENLLTIIMANKVTIEALDGIIQKNNYK